MSNIEKNENKKVKGNGFFKGLEGVGKTSGYLIKLVAIFTIIITRSHYKNVNNILR